MFASEMEISTRNTILLENFKVIQDRGYQALRADKVVAGLGITKGALYHYFPGKNALGIAVIDEIIKPMYVNQWQSINTEINCIDALCEKIETIAQHTSPEHIKKGCVLNNLMQEMSTIDEEFRQKLRSVLVSMHQSVESIIVKGIEAGEVQDNTDASTLAWYIIASVEGAFSIAKNLQSAEVFAQCINALTLHLQSFKKQ